MIGDMIGESELIGKIVLDAISQSWLKPWL